MKKVLFPLIALVLVSCSESEESNQVIEINKNVSKKESIDSVKTLSSETTKVSVSKADWKSYNGDFFEVQYPSNFSPSPIGPKSKLPDSNIETIATDEASFYAPDSSVVFFVYSPQWSGAPKDYLQPRSNEKLIETESKEVENGLYVTTMETASFEDTAGLYKRAYLCITEAGDSETRKIFGIQYKSQEAYDTHLEAYKEFKKSLRQFAD